MSRESTGDGFFDDLETGRLQHVPTAEFLQNRRVDRPPREVILKAAEEAAKVLDLFRHCE